MAITYGALKKSEIKDILKREFKERDGKMSMAEIADLLNSKGAKTAQGKIFNRESAGTLARSLGFRQRKKRRARVMRKKIQKTMVSPPKEKPSFDKISLAEMVLTHQLLPEHRKLDILGEILKL